MQEGWWPLTCGGGLPSELALGDSGLGSKDPKERNPGWAALKFWQFKLQHWSWYREVRKGLSSLKTSRLLSKRVPVKACWLWEMSSGDSHHVAQAHSFLGKISLTWSWLTAVSLPWTQLTGQEGSHAPHQSGWPDLKPTPQSWCISTTLCSAGILPMGEWWTNSIKPPLLRRVNARYTQGSGVCLNSGYSLNGTEPQFGFSTRRLGSRVHAELGWQHPMLPASLNFLALL